MTERDPFQNIIDGLAGEEVEEIEEPKVETADAKPHGKGFYMLAGFLVALLQLAAWSLLFGVGVMVISENLHDADVTTLSIPFWEAWGIGIGTIIAAIALKEGTR